MEPLDAMNSKKYAKGWTGDQVSKNGDNVEVPVTVTDAELIERIVTGAQEQVSCGYFCTMDETPGVWEGHAYDARQRNIEYNHLASVPIGRAGPENKIRMDSADAIMTTTDPELMLVGRFQADGDGIIWVTNAGVTTDDQKKNPSAPVLDMLDPEKDALKNGKKENPMAKIKIDGAEYDVADGLAPVLVTKLDLLSKATDELKASKSLIETLQGKADAAEAGLKKETERADAAVKSAQIEESEILKRADALNKSREIGKAILAKDFKDDMDTKAIKLAVVQKELPNVKVSEKTDEYVNAFFDGVVARMTKDAGKGLENDLSLRAGGGSNGRTSEQARLDSMNESKDRFKNHGKVVVQ